MGLGDFKSLLRVYAIPHVGGIAAALAESLGGGGGSSGSGGGGRVLCTYYTIEKKWLPKRAYVGNLKYGERTLSEKLKCC